MAPMLTRLCALVIFSLGLVACGGNYEITDPEKGSIHQTPPSITIQYTEKPEALPKTTLNGSEITGLFVLGDTDATAAGAAIAEFVKEGINDIKINDNPAVTSHFIYDTQAPKISVISAERGSFTTISGRAIDTAGIASLTINGLAIDVNEDGSFVADLSPADIYTFEVEDLLGHAAQVQYREYSLLYDDSLKARVNQSGLDFIASELVDIANGLDYNDLLGNTELYKSGIFRGELTSVNSIAAESFSLDPTNNDLRLNGVFRNISAKLRLVNIIVIKPTVNIASATFNGSVLVGVNGGEPDIVVSDLNVDLEGISFSGALGGFDRFLGGLISGLVERFEGRIGSEIKKAVNNVLSEQIAGLIPSTAILNINGKQLELIFNLKDISTSNDSLFVGLSGGVLPISINPLIPEPLGPIYTADSLPAPKPGGDLGIAVNTNVINQTLVGAYTAGITHLTLINDQVLFDIPRDDSVGDVGDNRILVNPGAAPYIQLNESDGESSTTFDIRNLEVVSQKKSAAGWQNEFTVELDVSAAINVSVNKDATLAVNFVSDPVIDIQKTIIGTGLTIPDSFIEGLLRSELPGIVRQLSGALSGIMLPQLAGFVTIANDFHPLGVNNTHAGLTATLDKAPLPENQKRLALFSTAHSKYFSAEGNGGGTVNANRDNAGPWETFLMAADEDCIMDGSSVSIETGAKYYFSAQDNGNLHADRKSAGSWEHFSLVNHTDVAGCLEDGDSVSLRSVHGKYLVAEDNGSANADRDGIGSWERFQVVFAD